jgi:alkanesulfonate monooxygenase SsuD/methylene tetrahydromethanopterin reductase-like flavin-dependent oxidoreductase (luciferase family)
MTRTDPADVPRPRARLHFGVFFQGVNHTTIWSSPDSGSQISPLSYLQVAQTAERGLFDAFFLGEGLRLREVGGRIHDLDIAGRPDAITQLAALAAVTDRIGLVSTSNVTFNDPADLARRLAGLDLLSGGRAGWNVVTTDNAWTGENFRRGGYLDHADRYRRAEQVLRAARAIWDGWADGAFGAQSDGASGAGPGAPSWLRPGSVRAVEVHDDLVDIEVTPTLPRSAQGHPVIFQAGDSSEGRDFAARHADVIFSAHGTDFDDALDKAEWVRREQVTPRTALAMAGLIWNRDLSDRDPDGPLPSEEPNEPDQSGAFGSARFNDARETVTRWRQAAEANGWSLRETVIRLGRRGGGHVGTPSGLADKFAHFVRHGAIDGFNVSPYIVPGGLDDIVGMLVPALQERGVYPGEYQGTTLREYLGLRAARSARTAGEQRRVG